MSPVLSSPTNSSLASVAKQLCEELGGHWSGAKGMAVSASETIVALKKYWPPTGTKDDPAKFPPMLFQQADLRRDSDGRPIVLVITWIGPGAISLP